MELATGEFIRRKGNLTFAGSSGLGKTHLKEGIGKKCCALRYRVRYETSASLVETLNKTWAVRALAQKVNFYCSYDFLIIDELGFEKLERGERGAQRIFIVHRAKDLYCCFRCGSTGNVLDFWSAYRGLLLYPAGLKLHQQLSARPAPFASRCGPAIDPVGKKSIDSGSFD